MPVRPRRARRRRYEWSPRVAVALTCGAPGPAIPKATLRAAWAEQGAFLIGSSGDVASLAGFWLCEPGVPDSLRAEPFALQPVEQADQVDAKREQLYVRRRAWLVERRPDLDDYVGGPG